MLKKFQKVTKAREAGEEGAIKKLQEKMKDIKNRLDKAGALKPKKNPTAVSLLEKIKKAIADASSTKHSEIVSLRPQLGKLADSIERA